MKKIQLARYGGLSPVKQTHYTTDYDSMTYHGAPERYGFYAFLWPYIDWFLLGGTDKLKEDQSGCKAKRDALNAEYRKFSVDGYIWTHIDVPKAFRSRVVEERGSWRKLHSSDFEDMFSKVYARTIGESIASYTERGGPIDFTVKSAFKFFSTDHLEIFVPKGTRIV